MEIYFVRHGQTIFNLMSKMQGWSDTPLTDKGVEDLKKTGEYLKNTHFDALYSSDLKRAMDTAKILESKNEVSKLNLKTSRNFREIFFGSFEGLNNIETWKDIGRNYGINNQNDIIKKYSIDFARNAMKDADPFHYAENADELNTRMNDGFRQLLRENEIDSRILVVTHGTFIKTMMLKFYDKDMDPADAYPENGSVLKANLSNDGIKILEFNIKGS